MDLSKPTIPPPSNSPLNYQNTLLTQTAMNNKSSHKEPIATTERIPTSTLGPFTVILVVCLVLFTCFILNCSRIRRTVDGRRMDKLGRSGVFKKKSFERRHKDLQEADLEWNDHPPIVYEEKLPATPESIHCSNQSSISSSAWSSNSTTVAAAAQSHHYTDINFIRNQPPSIQLRLQLENASSPSLLLVTEPNLALLPSRASSKSSSSHSSSSSSHSFLKPYQAALAPMPPIQTVTSFESTLS
ncbi:hypothetical protein BD770DRAFT_389198 [Pilaira anomala]|nr:hypothetical protein BD770DRAFT_389198 [Pilaira anomala]